MDACAPVDCAGAECEPEIVATMTDTRFTALAVDDRSVYLVDDIAKRLYRFDKARYAAGEEAIESLGSTGELASDVAVDEAYVYFANVEGIYRFEKPGGEPPSPGDLPTVFAGGRASRIALDDQTIYWVRREPSGDPPTPVDCVFRADKDTEPVVPSPIYAGLECTDLVLDEEWAYLLVNDGKVTGRVPKDGGAALDVMLESDTHRAIEVDETHLYATTNGTQVHRVGKEPPHEALPSLILQRPSDLVWGRTAPSTFYFLNDVDGGKIQGTVGDQPFTLAISALTERPEAIAADAEYVYWTAHDPALRRAPRCRAK